MILHAHAGFCGRVIDLETGQAVRKVIWFNTNSQELEAYQVTATGAIARDGNGNYLTYRARGRFRFVPADKAAAPARIILGAPTCSKCGSPLTLPGAELCAFCNAVDKGVKGFKVEPLTTPLFDRPCQRPGCGRLAEYAVSDEVTATPQLAPGVLRGRAGKLFYERGTTVARRWWCSWHYQAPRLLDAKGEVVQVYEEAGGVRPQ